MDFREVLVWREDSPLKRRVAEIGKGLRSDEVMNLQFTRCARASWARLRLGRSYWAAAVLRVPQRLSRYACGVSRLILVKCSLYSSSHITISSIMRSPSRGTCGSPPQTSYVRLPSLHTRPCLPALAQATSRPSSTALIRLLLWKAHPPADVPSTRLVLGNLAAWTHGACIVYPAETYSPPAIVDALVDEGCTALHGVPTHHLGVLHEVQRRRAEGEIVDTSRLRCVSYVGCVRGADDDGV